MSLLNLDIKSLIGVLIWGSFSTALIVAFYRLANPRKIDVSTLRYMALNRFLTGVGYLLLFFRGEIPDIFSVNLGNSLVFVCFFLEARILLKINNIADKRAVITNTSMLVFSLVAFNGAEFFFHDPYLRVPISSVMIFAIWLPPTIALIGSRSTNWFKNSVSIFYVTLLATLVLRTGASFFDHNVVLTTNNFYQTLMFIFLILMMTLNVIIYLLFLKEQADIQIERMAHFDQLTELPNRYHFFDRSNQYIKNFQAGSGGLVLLFFDLDRFKEINDTYGHRFGDEVLSTFADVLQKSLRTKDLCCRYGGEEFLALLQGGITEGRVVYERISQLLRQRQFPALPDFHITVSAGLVPITPETEAQLEDFIHKADEALYHAKNTGRNKLVTYEELLTAEDARTR